MFVAGAADLVLLLFSTFLLAQALGELLQRLRQPALVGEILAGILIANIVVGAFSLRDFLQLTPTAPGDPLNPNLTFLEALADLGVIFLIFAVGLEIRTTELRRVGRLATQVAVLGVVVPLLFGFAFIEISGGNPTEAIFVGAAMVATSVGITARVLREMNLLATREARVILGAAVIDDVLGILILTIAIGAASGGVNLYQIAIVAALATVFVLVSLTLGPRFVRHMARPEGPAAILKRMRSHNAPFVVALLFCLGMSALASFFQLAAIIGAFLAGMAMAEIREQYALEASFEPINAFFVPFFFLVIGLKVDLEALAAVWPLAVVLTFLAVVSKLLGCGIGARSMGRTSAAIVSIGMVPRGEVGIIVALAGLSAGAVTGSLYSAVVVMSLATSMMAPSLLARLFRRLEAERMGPPGAAEP